MVQENVSDDKIFDSIANAMNLHFIHETSELYQEFNNEFEQHLEFKDRLPEYIEDEIKKHKVPAFNMVAHEIWKRWRKSCNSSDYEKEKDRCKMILMDCCKVKR